ncbi:hypothetical protein GCM10010441_17520 [Kitasatospora paracochleata]
MADVAQRGDGVDGLLGGPRGVRAGRWVREAAGPARGGCWRLWGRLGPKARAAPGPRACRADDGLLTGRSTSPLRAGGGRRPWTTRPAPPDAPQANSPGRPRRPRTAPPDAKRPTARRRREPRTDQPTTPTKTKEKGLSAFPTRSTWALTCGDTEPWQIIRCPQDT